MYPLWCRLFFHNVLEIRILTCHTKEKIQWKITQQRQTCLRTLLSGCFQELYIPVEEIVSAPSGLDTGDRCAATMARVLRVLQVTSDVVEGVGLHRLVIIQLLTYLMFYITTTVFNKLVMNGRNALAPVFLSSQSRILSFS